MAEADINIYEGADYGFDPYYGDFLGGSYRTPVGTIGLAIDPRTANQLKETSDKLSTGAKAIEVQMTMPEVAESIPQQHLKEINRLKKLVGTELTLHGAVVEPTGVSKQGWTESDRDQAERQMALSVMRGHELDPDGNILVTFHASNGLPDPETRFFNKKTGKEELKEFWVVDERTGQFTNLPTQKTYFEEEEKGKAPGQIVKERLDKQNKEAWYKSLQHVNFNVHQGSNVISQILNSENPEIAKSPEKMQQYLDEKKSLKELYREYAKGKGTEIIEEVEKEVPGFGGKFIQEQMSAIEHGDIYLRDSYGEFKNLFDQAYDAAKRTDDAKTIDKLNNFKQRIQPKLAELKEDPSKVAELSKELVNGIHTLRAIKPPKIFTPLKDFAVDKASKTFSNIAFQAYDKYKDTAPVISIENPPAGMGLNRSEEIKTLIQESRDKFQQRLIKEKGLSKEQAEKQAEKLIGATWDVGHINMIRKFGYGKAQLLEEAKKIAPFVKHVHLSDNFGMEHTELPMGMGNVPKEQFEFFAKNVKGYKDKVKKIVETGQWYQHFKTSPFAETLRSFGSPIYGMKMAPYWSQTPIGGGGYFAGHGMNPDVHHSIYGAGFSTLPVELGGQMAGKSRLSGAPIE